MVWYEEFLLANAQRIEGIENILTALSYILPGRFKDADIVSEMLYMLLRFITLKHDKIIGKVAHKFKNKSLHSKYMDYACSNKKYDVLAHLLTSIEYLETVFEMIVQRKSSENAKWHFITMVESVKFVLKLILFKFNNQRMLIYPYLPGRDADPQDIMAEQPVITWKGDRSNHEYNTLQSMTRYIKQDSKYDNDFLVGDNIFDEYIRSKALKNVVSGPESILPSLKGLNFAVEIASHFRPLLYGIRLLFSSFNTQIW
eukprot:NODE_276_length_12087_cov_0.626376.p6 type:complete len:257 gc:universal NODE_276_length_12087_cov_0.626376:5440-4670(-)